MIGDGVTLGVAVAVGAGGITVICAGWGRVESNKIPAPITAIVTTTKAMIVANGDGSGTGESFMSAYQNARR